VASRASELIDCSACMGRVIGVVSKTQPTKP
jgi:hypothetical protein